jgi:hypothetical protein
VKNIVKLKGLRTEGCEAESEELRNRRRTQRKK